MTAQICSDNRARAPCQVATLILTTVIVYHQHSNEKETLRLNREKLQQKMTVQGIVEVE